MAADMLLLEDAAGRPRMAVLRGVWVLAMRAPVMFLAGCALVQGSRRVAPLFTSHTAHAASTIFAASDSGVDLGTTASDAAVVDARIRGGMRAPSILTGGGIPDRPITRTACARVAG